MSFNYINLKKIVNIHSVFKFLTVAIGTVSVYFFVMIVLLNIIQVKYTVSISGAYMAGAIFNFFANRKFTFNAQHKHIKIQTIRYIILLLINYLLTLIVAQFVVEILSLSAYIGAMLAIVCTAIVTYFSLGLWVFNINSKTVT